MHILQIARNHVTGALHRWTLDKVLKGAGVGSDPTEIDAAQGGSPIVILPQHYTSIGAGTYRRGVNALSNYNCYLDNGTALQSADGDNISYSVYIPAGTYTLEMVHRGLSTGGIVDIDIDAVEVASFDNYDTGETFNEISTQAGIVIASSGLKTLKLRLDGKNGASSDYQMTVALIVLWRTA